MSSSRNVEHFLNAVSPPNEPLPEQVTTHPNSPIPVIRNHITYYLPRGDLFIRVENKLFRVHSYFFTRESQDWRNLLGRTNRGRTAADPIVLDDDFSLHPRATTASFAHFLWVFYNPRFSIYEASEETWMTIQLYAIQWQMAMVQDLVDRELDFIRRANYTDAYYVTTGWSYLDQMDPGEAAIRTHLEDDHGP